MNSQLAALFKKNLQLPVQENLPVKEDLEDKNEDNNEKPYISEGMSVAQIKDREERIVFVGNVNILTKKSGLVKHFKDCGKIQKLWFRSVPTVQSKKPKRAQVILKEHADACQSMNCYILFELKESIGKALALNGSVLDEHHLRVNQAYGQKNEYRCTVFVGNLNFHATEDELREWFNDCGEIANLRIIRDPETYIGKGFAYVTFSDKVGYQNAVRKNGEEFKKRQLRISKAVENPIQKQPIKKKKSISVDKRSDISGILARKRESSKEVDKLLKFSESIRQNKNAEYNLIGTNTIKQSRKHFKKIGKKGLSKEEAFEKSTLKNKFLKEKSDRTLFNNVNELEVRREKRAKKSDFNRNLSKMKKVKKSASNQEA